MIERLFTFTGTGELLGQGFVQSAAARRRGARARRRGAGAADRRARAWRSPCTAPPSSRSPAGRRRCSRGQRAASVRWRERSRPGIVFGLLGLRQRERDSVIGVVLAFGLGLGVLMIALYPGRAANKFGLLTGSIVGSRLDEPRGCSARWRSSCWPCSPSSTGRCCSRAPTPRSPSARGVPVRLLSPLFAVLIASDDGAGGADRRGGDRARGHRDPGRRRRAGDGEPGGARTLLAVAVRRARAGGRHGRVARAGAARERATSRRSRSLLRRVPPAARADSAGLTAPRRATSASTTPAATEALSDSTGPAIGIDTVTSQVSLTSRDSPLPSEPTTSTSGSAARSNSSRLTEPSASKPGDHVARPWRTRAGCG